MPPIPLPTATVAPLATQPAAATAEDSTIALTIDGHTVQVELASTSAQRAQGLMFRESMPEERGMLFVFPDDQMRSFWMRNTLIPLSIAFMDADRRIINILDMEPLDESLYNSEAPARYALEVNQGWFEERGIVSGTLVEFQLPPDLVIE
ncbi:MAG: DUF192 domain-containing protein [Chloroflexaceae bacterium]|nr:DUF192 domain-containing protein [Chloroflexaceae bacterium]